MARPIPPGRFEQLIAVATKTFIARGYRQTQIADVAEALGVAKGTVYGYVASKEALFDACVRYADGHEPLPSPSELPVGTPPPGATVAYIRQRIAVEARDMVLLQVVTGTLVIREARRELSAVLSDLFRRIARNRRAVKIVDRCAADYPELATAWFDEGRGGQQVLLEQLIEARGAKKRLRRVDNAEVVARTLLEAIAFWAMHRHFGASPPTLDDEVAERAVIDVLVHGLLVRP